MSAGGKGHGVQGKTRPGSQADPGYGQRPAAVTVPTKLAGTAAVVVTIPLAAQQRPADNRAASRRVFADHNARRTAEAALVQVARVRAALAALGDQTPPLYAQAAQLRIDHPADSLTELAAHAAVTKYVLAGRLRRLLVLAERPANGH
jgi:hypothetical protein